MRGLCIAGGVVLNCVGNGCFLLEGHFEWLGTIFHKFDDVNIDPEHRLSHPRLGDADFF